MVRKIICDDASGRGQSAHDDVRHDHHPPGRHYDLAALARLASLDSGRVPAGDVLVAEVDGTPRAAFGVASREVLADPFFPTRELVSLLDRRAALLRAETMPRRARARARLSLWSDLWLRAAEAGRLR